MYESGVNHFPKMNCSVLATYRHQGMIIWAQITKINMVQVLDVNLIVLLLVRCDWISEDSHASRLIRSNYSFVHHLYNFQQLILV